MTTHFKTGTLNDRQLFFSFGTITPCAISPMAYKLSESYTKTTEAHTNILSLLLGCINFVDVSLFHEVYEPSF